MWHVQGGGTVQVSVGGVAFQHDGEGDAAVAVLTGARARVRIGGGQVDGIVGRSTTHLVGCQAKLLTPRMDNLKW